MQSKLLNCYSRLDDSSASSERTTTYATFPPSPDKGTEADQHLQSPGRPQAARTTAAATATVLTATPTTSVAINGINNGRNLIPEEMYNLLQLAEVSLAASAAGASASVLDRWHQRQQQHYRRHHHQLELVRAVLAAPLVTVGMDKPLDLSRDPSSSSSSSASGKSGGAQVRILTPSPSPTPSSTTEESHHHLTMSLGLRKNGCGPRQSSAAQQHQKRTDAAAVPPDLMTDDEVGEDSSTCWSPSADEAASVEDAVVVMHKSSSNSINSKASSSPSSSSGSDNNSHSGDGHECPDCGKRYSTSSNLARHRQTHRSPADQKVPLLTISLNKTFK